MIVKKRSIQLLVRLSDFDELQNDTAMQSNLVEGVLKMFASDENDNADLCLKMGCIQYMSNFFNDANFKVNAYQQMVPTVVDMGSKMLTKCGHNSEAVNEILELYRFIVDKYAGMVIPMDQTTGQTVIDFLVSMLMLHWNHFLGVVTHNSVTQDQLQQIDFEELYGEESIGIQSIVRIMNHIVIQVKIPDLNEQASMTIFNSAMIISTQALLMSAKNIMLCDSAMALYLSILRVLGNAYYSDPKSRGLGEALLGQFE